MNLPRDNSEGVYEEISDRAFKKILNDLPAVIIGLQGAVIVGLVIIYFI